MTDEWVLSLLHICVNQADTYRTRYKNYPWRISCAISVCRRLYHLFCVCTFIIRESPAWAFQYVQVQCVKMWHAGVCYGPEREREKTLSDAASLKLLQWCMSFRKSKPKRLPLAYSSCSLPTLSNLIGCSGWVSHLAMTAAYLSSLHPGRFTLQVSFLTAHTSLIETLFFSHSLYTIRAPKQSTTLWPFFMLLTNQNNPV